MFGVTEHWSLSSWGSNCRALPLALSPWLALCCASKTFLMCKAATWRKRRFHFLFKNAVFLTLPSHMSWLRFKLNWRRGTYQTSMAFTLLLARKTPVQIMENLSVKDLGDFFLHFFSNSGYPNLSCCLSHLLLKTPMNLNSLKAKERFYKQVSYLKMSLWQLLKKMCSRKKEGNY